MSVFLPDNTRIPPSGSNIHVQIWGSIDPGMVLRFTAEPDEARAFVQQVRQAWSMTPGVLEKGEYEAKPHNCPSDRWHADWWQARDDLPWWVDSRGHGCEFVQLVEHESTVYFFVSLH